jgi:hypothetical protein
MRATVLTPYYDWDGRKYLELNLEGSIIRVKVPFRYGRAMCKTTGLRTIHEIEKGTELDVILEKKVWEGKEHWILTSFEEVVQ